MFVVLLTYVIVAGDPFVAGGVATTEIVQFRASQTATGEDRI